MGDVADMMLEGILDCDTGEYIGDQTAEIFGTESPGFPVSFEEGSHYNPNNYLGDVFEVQKKSLLPPDPTVLYQCPICKRKLKSEEGYYRHYAVKHTPPEREE